MSANDVRGALDKIGQALWRLVALGRGNLVNDSGPVQRVQVAIGAAEVVDGMPRLAEYGFASNPPAGFDSAMMFIRGDRSNGIIIATGHQSFRLNLQTGEVAIHDDRGRSVWLTQDQIVINGGGQAVKVIGDLQVTGDVVAGFGGASVSSLNHLHGTGSPTAAGTAPPTAGT